jgi:hypothetical protein
MSRFPERGTDELESGVAWPVPTTRKRAYHQYNSKEATTFDSRKESRFLGSHKGAEPVAEKWRQGLSSTFFPNGEGQNEITDNIFHYATSHLASDAATGASLRHLRGLTKAALADVGRTIEDEQAWKESFRAIHSSVYAPDDPSEGTMSGDETWYEPPTARFRSPPEPFGGREVVQDTSVPTDIQYSPPMSPKAQFAGVSTQADLSTEAPTDGVQITNATKPTATKRTGFTEVCTRWKTLLRPVHRL